MIEIIIIILLIFVICINNKIKCKKHVIIDKKKESYVNKNQNIKKNTKLLYDSALFNDNYEYVNIALKNLYLIYKYKFNIGNKNIKKYIANDNTSINILNAFIDLLNKEIKNINVTNITKNIKSGWEVQQEKLGLPSSIYPHKIEHNNILIKIFKIISFESYKTSLETKHICNFIIHYENTLYKMILSVSFIIINNNDQYKINIEYVHILGFLYEQYIEENKQLIIDKNDNMLSSESNIKKYIASKKK
jgi:hypothetical protein